MFIALIQQHFKHVGNVTLLSVCNILGSLIGHINLHNPDSARRLPITGGRSAERLTGRLLQLRFLELLLVFVDHLNCLPDNQAPFQKYLITESLELILSRTSS